MTVQDNTIALTLDHCIVEMTYAIRGLDGRAHSVLATTLINSAGSVDGLLGDFVDAIERHEHSSKLSYEPAITERSKAEYGKVKTHIKVTVKARGDKKLPVEIVKTLIISEIVHDFHDKIIHFYQDMLAKEFGELSDLLVNELSEKLIGQYGGTLTSVMGGMFPGFDLVDAVIGNDPSTTFDPS